MPKRTDLRSILIIGSGPIKIGQACEFDYSGSQACRALRNAGYRVVLVNSNPATIMTDPEWADVTYMEPLDVDSVGQVIEKERPDALLPTLGGQTALNLAVGLHEAGILDLYGVELIGADLQAIEKAENRESFRDLMISHGLAVLDGVVISDVKQLTPGMAPAVVRPAFTLGGAGGGFAETDEQLLEKVATGLAASPIGEVLVEASARGWSEFELEVMSDSAGSCIVVCSIENIDPVGVHTGDSWTVAPQQTLSDDEYQRMRDAAFTCVRAVGVATGGANVQFAYRHDDQDLRIIEMNPRTSRSSALASKATGYPIAKLSALLAVGITLEELPNDITQKTTAAFEPALDYVAVKAPRFDFARFGVTNPTLGTQMQAIGEALGIGRTFPEALLRAHEGLETTDPLPEFTDAHAYFRDQLASIAVAEQQLALTGDMDEAKRFGLSDARIATILETTEAEVRRKRAAAEAMAVDSCAAEFVASTPYFYLSHEGDPMPTVERPSRKPIVIVGSGPNRIGQGIEFDYACVHGAMAFQAMGHEVVMVNSNPETVSTDYDTSDRLYVEPLTVERILDVCQIEDPLGVVVSLGGQTPLNLARGISEAGVPLIGLDLDVIAACEDRAKFAQLTGDLGIDVPEWGHAKDTAEARAIAEQIGYPVIVRPDYVIGGTGMMITDGPEDIGIQGPAIVDRYLAGAIELDVEVLGDGNRAWIAGILEHVEEAGVHSGDSALVFPSPSVSEHVASQIGATAEKLVQTLGLKGCLNLQFALSGNSLYLLEANPRASRTLPFLAKATGLPLLTWACQLMMGAALEDLALPVASSQTRYWAKEPVFPLDRFGDASKRGPLMRSTGEVMASGISPAAAYQRALRAAGRSSASGQIGPSLQSLHAQAQLKRSA